MHAFNALAFLASVLSTWVVGNPINIGAGGTNPNDFKKPISIDWGTPATAIPPEATGAVEQRPYPPTKWNDPMCFLKAKRQGSYPGGTPNGPQGAYC